VCTYVCMYACMCVRTYVCVCVCMYACMYVCMHVLCMCVRMYVRMCIRSVKYRELSFFNELGRSAMPLEATPTSRQHEFQNWELTDLY
jgi:hypothetical protein